MLRPVLFALAIPSVAAATPMQLTWQGRLLNANGVPFNGPTSLTISLYDSVDDETADWWDTFDVTLDQGFTSVVLGSDKPLDLADFTSGQVWAEATVAGAAVGPRQALLSVPFSLLAGGVTSQASPSAPCTAGAIRWDTAAEALAVCNGDRWVSVGGPPAGSISAFGGQVAPDGWLICDGRAVSRAEYAALFDAIGTAYGSGDGSTTFNLPDLRGRFLRGWDAMGGTAASRDAGRSLGSAQDATFAEHSHEHSLAINPSGSHDHSVSVGHTGNHNDFLAGSTSAYGIDGSFDPSRSEYGNFVSDETHSHPNSSFTGSISPTGGAETRPVNLSVTYIIRH